MMEFLSTWTGRILRVCLLLSLGLAAAPSSFPLEGQADTDSAPAPVGSIGVLDGDPETEFGHIAELVVDHRRGVLFEIDRLKRRLSAFSREGEQLASTGQEGGGPGEFRVLRALAFDGTNLYTYDNGTLRLATYAFQDDSLVLRAEARSPIINVWDICAMDGDLFVLRFDRGHLIHRVTPEGEVVASFGQNFRSEELQRLAQTLDIGHLLCDATTQSIYTSAYLTPVVRRYSANGELMWRAEVPGMVPTVVERNERGGVTFRRPEGSETHVTTSLALLPEGRLLVQFGRDLPGTPEDIVDVESVVYDVDDGSVLETVEDLPRIDVVSGGFAYSHANDPFPRILIYEVP